MRRMRLQSWANEDNENRNGNGNNENGNGNGNNENESNSRLHPVSKCVALFLGIPIGSVAWRGRLMDACSPPAPMTAPSASGMQRQDDHYTRLMAIPVRLIRSEDRRV